jgi:hypothetical protein
MAVIIQEVVGSRFNERFYPTLSGVARSYNFYPVGRAKPQEGVVDLALGLGKTIVDGGLVWSYSPVYPRVGPPVGSAGEMLKLSQTEFWAINMGRPPEYDPIKETEYLVKCSLADAEYDGSLKMVASTYQPQNDRIVTGIGADGPRVLNFAPILSAGIIPLNDLVKDLLEICREAVGSPVEMEFAMSIGTRGDLPARFGFLQVRPMVVSTEEISITEEELEGSNVLAASDRALGNGSIDDLHDIVFVDPETFNAKDTPRIATELAKLNRRLLDDGCPYLLIGFGRWGSSDPWLGMPVEWGQISGARAIIEATLPNMNVELSQGSHFFHNITSFQILYFSVRFDGRHKVDWDWLKQQDVVGRTDHVCHVRVDRPLRVKVDGRSSRGVILR